MRACACQVQYYYNYCNYYKYNTTTITTITDNELLQIKKKKKKKKKYNTTVRAKLSSDDHHNMAFLLIYILFWCSIQDTLSIPSLDFYLPSREDPNSLRLECINDHGVVYRNSSFKFYNNTNVAILFKELATDENSSYLTYNITEDFEVLVRCVIDGVHSEAVWFVGNDYTTMHDEYYKLPTFSFVIRAIIIKAILYKMKLSCRELYNVVLIATGSVS